MITNCRSCKSTDITEIFSLGNQYLSDFIEPGESRPDQFPLEMVMCRECSLVQLGTTTPPDKLYTERYGYRSGISNTMKKELKEIVEGALDKLGREPNLVVDIGANDGTLLDNYPGNFTKVAFEPVTKFADICREKGYLAINNFFDATYFHKAVGGEKADIITAISMFYDLEDPNAFVKGLRSILAEDGVLVIQQNYLGGMLKQNAFDNICHEHLEYYTLASLEKLLNRHQLEVFDVELTDINGGSFRTYVRHMDRVKQLRYYERKMQMKNEWRYILFAMKCNEIKKKLHKFIKEEVDKGKSVYIYGASTRGNTLIQYVGLDKTLIKAAVERNEEKWGKVIASTGIPIISEEQARKEKPDYFLVLPWFFKEEIIEREKAFREAGGKLIFPLPELEVVGA